MSSFDLQPPMSQAFTTEARFDACWREQIIAQLEADLQTLFDHIALPEPLAAACRYASSNGGKRVRPLLVASSFLQMSTASQQRTDHSLNHDCKRSPNVHAIAGCRRAMLAVELLHGYSLVHDDLPCMDDDALRRGQPTCHIAFDEATALLAGDALQSLAFEVLSTELPPFTPIPPELSARLLQQFAPRARRMVAGQMLDLSGEAKQLSQSELETIHGDKTGALMAASVLMGAVCAEATAKDLSILERFAQILGLAFQVQDDILDVTANTEQLGKPAGSDEKLDKSTYVKLMGVSEATAYAEALFAESQAQLNALHGQSQSNALSALADWLWQRKF